MLRKSIVSVWCLALCLLVLASCACRYDIVSMRLAQETSGRFFLGSGYINGSPCYYAYRRIAYADMDTVGYKLLTIPADKHTVIIQDAAQETAYAVYTQGWLTVTWTVHVPPETIIQEFVLR